MDLCEKGSDLVISKSVAIFAVVIILFISFIMNIFCIICFSKKCNTYKNRSRSNSINSNSSETSKLLYD